MVVVCNTEYPSESEYNSHFDNYPYNLSSFQKHAIEGILKNNHVLVTAHTGSGKTLPAEFAINHWVAQGKKVIYTSPIKALSNQKFYEFTQKFPHISFGLFTGDIKTNPEADVLIMTTEILMNRLFNQSLENETVLQFQMDFEKELAAVVFDEVHYINDTDRGQVWEKTILMLPDHVQMVMLSATLDRPERFAKWIETNHKNKKVYLCPTTHRVVPLTHYGYMTVGEHEFKLIKDKTLKQKMRKLSNKPIVIKDSKGKFNVEGYYEMKEVRDQMDKLRVRINRKFCLNQLAKHLKENDMLPAIGFVFSRKNVEACARELTTVLLEDDSKVPYKVKKEADQILRRLPNHEEYTRLPEYIELISFLEKGVGIHHSGMIPILREIVELFISKKYIKFLFATESFAIGLDCPIKTAVFTGITKFDGDNPRLLHSHEYTQMAGRAGRRGIDTVGHVIHCNSLFRAFPTQNEYKDILSGKPPNLISKFKIDYGLILNVLKSTPEVTMKKMTEFVEKSMMFDELRFEINRQKKDVKEIEDSLHKLDDQVNINKTPESVCTQYRELKSMIDVCQPKKRKNYQREMDNLKEAHPDLEKDVALWERVDAQCKIVQKERGHLLHLQQYITNQVIRICTFLETQGFLTIEADKIIAKEKGSICSHIAEVHGPVWVTCMIEKWKYFQDFTPRQLVGLLSCVTDVKVKEECEVNVVRTDDEFLKHRVMEMKDLYEYYDTQEGSLDIRTGIRYDEAFNVNIVEEAMDWCDCDSEEACKLFINEKLNVKGISLGDFTKAILKIATAAKELRGLYELEWCNTQTEWLHKLSQIEEMVLKYIATNQSLYV